MNCWSLTAARRPPCQGKATLNDADVVIQQARFDGLGRRVRKIVTNAGKPALDTAFCRIALNLPSQFIPLVRNGGCRVKGTIGIISRSWRPDP
jgi:hypothetical protein